MTTNALDKSLSPYLLQHKDNPVAWRPWGDEVLAEARAAGKPIFLSVGYTGCHWCHVMNGESFSNAATAALINEHFIPVLVDRQERPDLDQIFQVTAKIIGHSGGWPLTGFLNPDGVPYFMAGYLPPEDRAGQPSLSRLVTDMAARFKDQTAEVEQTVAAVVSELHNVFNADMQGTLDQIQLEMASIRIGQRFDIFMGGLMGANKFPSTTQLEVLWRAYLRTGVGQYMNLITTTMNNMLLAGLYDHVGGGFFRYTNDERWMVPHFEKTLCDNALLVSFMTEMWQFNRNELCRTRVSETVEWLLREMSVDGAFACGVAADSEGDEGQYYTWSEAEVDAALTGTFSARFKQVYGVRREGDFNGRLILRRLGANTTISDADEALLTKQLGLLRDARAKRPAPPRDGKLLADWNGLAISALAFAGSAFDKPEWIKAAVTAFDAIVSKMEDGGTLYHAYADGKRGPAGFSDDYALMAEAAIQLYESTGDMRYVEKAKAWVATLDAKFHDAFMGGYYYTSSDVTPLIIRTRTIYDQPAPSANGVMITLLTKLAMITGENDYGLRAQTVLTAFAGEFARNWISCTEYLNGFECFATGLQIVVVGKRSDARTQEFIRAVWGKALPNRLLVTVDKTEDLPTNHPAHGKPMENGQPTVYLCQRTACSPAFTSAVGLSQTLTLPQQQIAGAA